MKKILLSGLIMVNINAIDICNEFHKHTQRIMQRYISYLDVTTDVDPIRGLNILRFEESLKENYIFLKDTCYTSEDFKNTFDKAIGRSDKMIGVIYDKFTIKYNN